MNKETTSNESNPSTDTGTTVPSKPSGLSLVDIAKEQQGITTKPLTLVGVARNIDSTTDSAATTASLQSLAHEINAEERARVDRAITNAATNVKQEKAQERASALKAAAVEVQREEADEVSTLSINRLPAKASPPQPEPSIKVPESEHDGYSSFEDEEDEKKTVKKSTKKKQTVNVEKDDNQSVDTGPEKTIPNDSPVAKECLRAIFRGDGRRVRDLMREEDVDVNTADQHGWSALHWAASQGHNEILSDLLERTPRVNAVEYVNGWSPLHLAVLRDAVPCAKLLLRAGAHTTIPDVYGDTVHDLLHAYKGKKKEKWLHLLTRHNAT